MASGLAADDTYNLYDKPLFAERGSNLYRPNKAADEEAVGGEGRDEGADVRTERFKPTKVRSSSSGCLGLGAPLRSILQSPPPAGGTCRPRCCTPCMGSCLGVPLRSIICSQSATWAPAQG